MTDRPLGSFATLSRRQALTLLGATAASVALAAHAGSAAAAMPKTVKGQLTIAFSQEPTVFNPHLLHIEVDEGIHFSIFNPLFGIDENGKFTPALALDVPTVENGGISADGLHWHVKLRDDVQWHDGKPFTAEDVKFTLELLVDPAFRSWRRAGHDLVRDLTVVSPTEITWRLEKPYAPYASILASTFIVPKHAFDGVADKNNASFNNAPIGTGPYKWAERVAGDHILLTANTDYFGAGPHLEQVIYKYVPDLTVLYTQFKTGDVDVTGLQWITPDHYDEAKTLPGKIVQVVPGATIESLTFNMERPQFKELAVRQALYAALDKATIIEALYYGLPKPAESYMPQESFYYNPDLPKHVFDLDKAKALLDGAGWKPGADGIRAKNGIKLSFTNSTTAGNHIREQVQQYIQQNLKSIGIEMTISNLPPAVMWGDYWMLSKFDSVIVGLDFVTGDPDTSDFFLSGASPAKGGGGQNTWQYVNPEVDKLLMQGASSFKPEERKVAYLKIQELIRADLPFLPMFQFATVRGRAQDVKGFTPNVNTRIDSWNIGDWSRG
ncbi:MAG: peptide ABC transporter substrate-binding protein [Azospirillaceae bacterium]|nr:peptide ABC transporter substrate-binding protein [Azospirillaceae bacterium]